MHRGAEYAVTDELQLQAALSMLQLHAGSVVPIWLSVIRDIRDGGLVKMYAPRPFNYV